MYLFKQFKIISLATELLLLLLLLLLFERSTRADVFAARSCLGFLCCLLLVSLCLPRALSTRW
jgi:hypothetical protein